MLYFYLWFSWYFSQQLTGKTKRLKEAKEEAQAEIEIFRKEQEKEFQDYQRDVSYMSGLWDKNLYRF